MKVKTVNRFKAAIDTVACTVIGDYLYNFVSNTHYREMVNVLSNDSPLEHKIIAGTGLAITTLSIPFVGLAGLLMVNGVYDLVNGTHLYLPMKIVQKLMKDPNKKANLQRYLDHHLEFIERDAK